VPDHLVRNIHPHHAALGTSFASRRESHPPPQPTSSTLSVGASRIFSSTGRRDGQVILLHLRAATRLRPAVKFFREEHLSNQRAFQRASRFARDELFGDRIDMKPRPSSAVAPRTASSPASPKATCTGAFLPSKSKEDGRDVAFQAAAIRQ